MKKSITIARRIEEKTLTKSCLNLKKRTTNPIITNKTNPILTFKLSWKNEYRFSIKIRKTTRRKTIVAIEENELLISFRTGESFLGFLFKFTYFPDQIFYIRNSENFSPNNLTS